MRKASWRVVLTLVVSTMMATAVHAATTCGDLKSRTSATLMARALDPEWKIDIGVRKLWRITNIPWLSLALECDEATDEVIDFDARLEREDGATPTMQALFEYAMLVAIDPQTTPAESIQIWEKARHAAMRNSPNGLAGTHEFEFGPYSIDVLVSTVGPRYSWTTPKEKEEFRKEEEYKRLHPEEFLDDEEEG
jgi:hypothetical protein